MDLKIIWHSIGTRLELLRKEESLSVSLIFFGRFLNAFGCYISFDGHDFSFFNILDFLLMAESHEVVGDAAEIVDLCVELVHDLYLLLLAWSDLVGSSIF